MDPAFPPGWAGRRDFRIAGLPAPGAADALDEMARIACLLARLSRAMAEGRGQPRREP
jgi:hypothetical protein